MDCVLEMVLSSHTCWEGDRRHRWSGWGRGRCKHYVGWDMDLVKIRGFKGCATVQNSRGTDLVSALVNLVILSLFC